MGLRHLGAAGLRVCGFLLVVASGPTSAAPVGEVSPGLEEIVVTATRRAERLEDVPISVTAFTQERLDQQGLRSIDDITRLTPGITFQRNGTSQNYNDEGSDINIRGIDSTAGTSTTGVYINDTPIQ
ncbi:MAG: TonB-dependent receptor plug domain-containing protein, partial [Pseudomonadota bacterium]|nr:TonB-dependent receptor plug domain-containing protein [Pseudomonadota bacterium]